MQGLPLCLAFGPAVRAGWRRSRQKDVLNVIHACGRVA